MKPECVHCGHDAAVTLACRCETLVLCSGCVAHYLECECRRLVIERLEET